MDLLRTLWPTAFKVKEKDAASLVIQLILLIVVCVLIGILIGVLAGIPVVNILAGIVGSLVELYGFVGIVLCIANFLGVFSK